MTPSKSFIDFLSFTSPDKATLICAYNSLMLRCTENIRKPTLSLAMAESVGQSMNIIDLNGKINKNEKENLMLAIREYGPKLLELKTE